MLESYPVFGPALFSAAHAYVYIRAQTPIVAISDIRMVELAGWISTVNFIRFIYHIKA